MKLKDVKAAMGLFPSKVQEEPSKPDTSESDIYHERQVKELCALHSLNNILQEKGAFTQKNLDDICTSLSPNSFFNPHRSIFGTGNYDVNVLMVALKSKGYEVVWHDKRKTVEDLELGKALGFILNIPTKLIGNWPSSMLNRRHWLAVRKVNDSGYYNLDSKLKEPQLIGDEEALKEFLEKHLKTPDAELLTVIEEKVSQQSD